MEEAHTISKLPCLTTLMLSTQPSVEVAIDIYDAITTILATGETRINLKNPTLGECCLETRQKYHCSIGICTFMIPETYHMTLDHSRDPHPGFEAKIWHGYQRTSSSGKNTDYEPLHRFRACPSSGLGLRLQSRSICSAYQHYQEFLRKDLVREPDFRWKRMLDVVRWETGPFEQM
ncbi:hypothetical protein NDA13_004504 [Ustilago tritici]|nr:hypothetical protein NDA13_004504 [Ustilago tritici]